MLPGIENGGCVMNTMLNVEVPNTLGAALLLYANEKELKLDDAVTKLIEAGFNWIELHDLSSGASK